MSLILEVIETTVFFYIGDQDSGGRKVGLYSIKGQYSNTIIRKASFFVGSKHI